MSRRDSSLGLVNGSRASAYLVDPAERRHVHRLPPHNAGTADTGGVLTGSAVDDGVDQDLQGVLRGRNGTLSRARQEKVLNQNSAKLTGCF